MSIEINERPLVSFVLLAYNQERFIREAVEGAFAQTYSPLEIILSDDCSTDRTFVIMREMASRYKGPHSLKVNRCKRNLGTNRHLNVACTLSKGVVLVFAAGDDVSSSERTERLLKEFQSSGDLTKCVTSDFNAIDAAGEPIPGGYRPNCSLTYKNFIRGRFGPYGAASAMRRELLDFFGPLGRGYHEDSVLLHRALLLGEVKYLPQTLVKVRRHSANYSGADGVVPEENEFQRSRRFYSLADIETSTCMLQDYLYYVRCNGRDQEQRLASIYTRLREGWFWWSFYSGSPWMTPFRAIQGLLLSIPPVKLYLATRSFLKYRLKPSLRHLRPR